MKRVAVSQPHKTKVKVVAHSLLALLHIYLVSNSIASGALGEAGNMIFSGGIERPEIEAIHIGKCIVKSLEFLTARESSRSDGLVK